MPVRRAATNYNLYILNLKVLHGLSDFNLYTDVFLIHIYIVVYAFDGTARYVSNTFPLSHTRLWVDYALRSAVQGRRSNIQCRSLRREMRVRSGVFRYTTSFQRTSIIHDVHTHTHDSTGVIVLHSMHCLAPPTERGSFSLRPRSSVKMPRVSGITTTRWFTGICPGAVGWRASEPRVYSVPSEHVFYSNVIYFIIFFFFIYRLKRANTRRRPVRDVTVVALRHNVMRCRCRMRWTATDVPVRSAGCDGHRSEKPRVLDIDQDRGKTCILRYCAYAHAV